VSFLLAAMVLVHRGRRLPRHLPGLLDTWTVIALMACALLFPAMHAGILLLTGDAALWPFVLGLNLLPAMALAVRTTVVHLVQRRRFVREGIDLRVLQDRVVSLKTALQVLQDRLDLAIAVRPEPEPWERIAGDALGITEVPLGDVQRLVERAASRIPELDALEREIAAEADRSRDPGTPRVPDPQRSRLEARLAALQREVDDLLRESEECLGEEPLRPSSWIR
jgi:uncharacterized membrane protein